MVEAMTIHDLDAAVADVAPERRAHVLAQVSDSIRSGDGIGEILFVQTGARRSSAARSDDGRSIERGTEVVVIRYERGVAYVRPWAELEGDPFKSLVDR